jgi:hypothetical protein
MTHAVVVYESIFGNTKAVTDAVVAALAERCEDVRAVEVGVAPQRLDGEDLLLVVGGPTHAFSLSRPQTRETAREQAGGDSVSAGIGLREWLAELEVPAGTRAAAFDTRIKKKFVPGSAARSAEKRLRRLGVTMAAPPESFWVADVSGPLLEGERERARAWALTLVPGPGEGGGESTP